MALAPWHTGNRRVEIFVVNEERVDEIAGCDDALADHASNGGGLAIAARTGSLRRGDKSVVSESEVDE